MTESNQDIIQRLIKARTENENVDYKEFMNWDTCQKSDKGKIVKDLLAMANTKDGGKLIFGIEDGSFDFQGLTNPDYSSFDPTKVNDFLHKYTEPKISCNVEKYELSGGKTVVISISEFDEEPIICKKDLHSSDGSNEQILKQGAVYIRTESAQSIIVPSAHEMRELLGRAITRKSDNLLNSIARMIKGRPKRTESETNPYQGDIEEAYEYFESVLKDNLESNGYWEVVTYPVDFKNDRITEYPALKKLMESAKVFIRGWYFPHTDTNGGASNINKGIQSHTIWDQFAESYRVLMNGLFIWSSVFWEDTKGMQREGHPVLSYVSAIYSLTEFFLFFKRYYEFLSYDGDVNIMIKLNKTNGRMLHFDGQVRMPFSRYICQDKSIIIEKPLDVVTLKSEYRELAIASAKEVFALFNADDIHEKAIESWQKKILKE